MALFIPDLLSLKFKKLFQSEAKQALQKIPSDQ